MPTIKDLIDLKGRYALLTGATGGLGVVMADTLAELGADLILVDHPRANFVELTTRLKKRWNVKIWHYHCDLEDHNQRLELLSKISERQQALNILINNAAFGGTSDLAGWVTPFELQSVETWRRAIEVNLTAPFHLSQGLVSLLRAAESPTIINIGSIYGEYGPDWRLYENTSMGNPAAYGASKGGLLQLTRWLATTLSPSIRVNAIAPGGIFRNQPDVFVKRYESRTPAGRMGSEEDFRGITAYLASDMSKYVNGQVISVDGGWGIW